MFKTHKYVKITSLMLITFITETILKHTIHLQLQDDRMYVLGPCKTDLTKDKPFI